MINKNINLQMTQNLRFFKKILFDIERKNKHKQRYLTSEREKQSSHGTGSPIWSFILGPWDPYPS